MKKILFLVLLVFASGCAAFKQGGVKVKYPNPVSSEMRSEFSLAENEFKAQRYPQAEVGFRNYSQRYPYNALSDLAEYRIGQIKLLRKDYAGATQTFDALIGKTPDPGVASRARVKAGIAQYRLGNYSSALSYFDKTDPAALGENDRIKLGGLALAALDRVKGNSERKGFYDAVLLDSYQNLSESSIQQQYGAEAPSRQAVLGGLKSWAQQPATVGQIDSRFSTYKAKASEPYVAYKLGMSYYKAGDKKLAGKYLARLVGKYPGNPLAKEAQPIFAQLGYKPGKEAKASGKRYKIGVILPLSGKYQVYGANTLKGMECAASVKAPCAGVSNIQIISRDDQGEPALAVKAVEELVKQEKVSAIVGPLSSASSMAAAQRAEELGVVMISLAQREGIPAIGANIFRFSLTPGEQVRAILEAAVKRGKKLLAVLYPNSNYGKVFLSTTQSMASKYGASVRASQGYGSAGNAAAELRQLKFSVSQASAQAPLGFNALFIPDSYSEVLKIAPNLKNAGLDQVQLLGTNAWNDPSIASQSGGLLEGSVFLDIYFKNSNSTLVKNFVSEFQAAFGGAPSTLEAMGYDAIRFLGQALAGRKASSASDVREAVASSRGYHGVTGLRSFSWDREAQVEPYMLTVESGAIKETK